MKLYSENAIFAKVMAMYGKRLSGNDYDRLLQRNTVGEVAAFLKSETGYSYELRDIREDLIHRSQLENLIRQRVLDVYLKLGRYSYTDDAFFRLFLMRSEVDQLLEFLRLLRSGETHLFVTTYPAYLSRHMCFDLLELARVRSYDELVELMKKTRYHPALVRNRPPAGALVDITACETSLLTDYYRDSIALVEGHYSGGTRKAVRDLLYMEIDLHNASLIMRMKRFDNASPDQIRAHLIGVKTSLRARILEAMTEARDEKTLRDIVKAAPLLRDCVPEAGSEQDYGFALHRRKVCYKTLRYSRSPVASLIGYMTLLRIEIGNIINIIEGKRYGVPSEEIKSLLVV